jgi:hypothetical protein
MYKQGTVFIVGAGASSEYKNFPVGSGLREIIRKNSTIEGMHDYGRITKGHPIFYEHLRNKYKEQELTNRIMALRIISEQLYMWGSIDAFIERNQDKPHVAEMGKIQIALAIATAERECKIGRGIEKLTGKLNIEAVSETWLDTFTRNLFTGVHDPEQLGQGLTVICFNYDRCIEFFLIHAISRSYGVEYGKAHRIVSQMNIIHPYGTLGALPAGLHGDGENSVKFGPELDYSQDPWRMIGGLKTYTEQVEEGETLEEIRRSIAYSSQLIFLGFGFTQENMKLLSCADFTSTPTHKKIYATGKGISPYDVAAVTSKISNLFAPVSSVDWPDQAVIQCDVTCGGLLNMYSHTFSA